MVGVGFASREVNFGSDTEREGELFEALAVFAVADDDEFGGDLFKGDGEGLDEGREVFLAGESASGYDDGDLVVVEP